MKTLFCLPIVLFVACGPAVPHFDTKGITSAAEVAKATGKVNSAISLALAQSPAHAVSGAAPGLFSRDCLTNGTKTGAVTGKLVASTLTSTDELVATYDLAFQNCLMDGAELYGTATWSYSEYTQGSGAYRHTLKLSGTLAVKIDDGAIQGNINYKDLVVPVWVTQTGTTLNYEGPITGSVDVNGKIFTPVVEDFRGVFDPQ